MIKTEYLTLDEAAQLLGKSVQTIRRMIKQKKIKAEMHESQYGKRYMIPTTEINQAVQTIDVANLSHPITPEAFAFEVIRQLREENKDLREAVLKLQEQQSATLLLLQDIKDNQQQAAVQKKWWKVW